MPPRRADKDMPEMARFPMQARRALIAALQIIHSNQDIDLSEYYLSVEQNRKACFSLSYGQIDSTACFSGSTLYPNGWKVAFTYEGVCWTGAIQVQQGRPMFQSAFVNDLGQDSFASAWHANPSAAFKEARRNYYANTAMAGFDVAKKEKSINGKLYFGCEYPSVQDVLREHFTEPLHDQALEALRRQWIARIPTAQIAAVKAKRVAQPTTDEGRKRQALAVPGSPTLTNVSFTDEGSGVGTPDTMATEYDLEEMSRLLLNLPDDLFSSTEDRLVTAFGFNRSNSLLSASGGDLNIPEELDWLALERDAQSAEGTRRSASIYRSVPSAESLDTLVSLKSTITDPKAAAVAHSGRPKQPTSTDVMDTPVVQLSIVPKPAPSKLNWHCPFSPKELCKGLLGGSFFKEPSSLQLKACLLEGISDVFTVATSIGVIHEKDGKFMTLPGFIQVLNLVECTIIVELAELLYDEPYDEVFKHLRTRCKSILDKTEDRYVDLGSKERADFRAAVIEPYVQRKRASLKKAGLLPDSSPEILYKAVVLAMFPQFKIHVELRRLQKDCVDMLANLIWRTTFLPPSNAMAKMFFDRSVWSL